MIVSGDWLYNLIFGQRIKCDRCGNATDIAHAVDEKWLVGQRTAVSARGGGTLVVQHLCPRCHRIEPNFEDASYRAIEAW